MTGKTGPGDRVRIFDGDALLGETVADANGLFRLRLPDLKAGAHSLAARTYDRNGTLLATSLPLAFTVLAPPPKPVTPVFTAPAANAVLPANALGEVAGTAAPGAIIRIFDGDKLLGETVAGADGKWRLALPALAVGADTLIAAGLWPRWEGPGDLDALEHHRRRGPGPHGAAPDSGPDRGANCARRPTATTKAPTPVVVAPTITGPASGTALAAGALAAFERHGRAGNQSPDFRWRQAAR